ncbi:MAG: VanZ family protein [Pseudomonadota bacterium]
MKTKKSYIPIVVTAAVISLASQYPELPVSQDWSMASLPADKAAHVGMYFFLGLFISRYLLVSLNLMSGWVVLLTGALCLSFGVFDEIHQGYVDGRSTEMADLMADLLGGLLGAAVLAGWYGLIRRAKELWAEKGPAAVLIRVLLVVPAGIAIGGLAVHYHPLLASTVEESGAKLSLSAKKTVAGLFGLQVPERDRGVENTPRATFPAAKASAKEAQETASIFSSRSGAVPIALAALNSVADASGQPEPRSVKEPIRKSRPDFTNTNVRPETPVEPQATLMPPTRNYQDLGVIAVLTHPENPVKELTVDQIRRLFSGQVDNWNQVGGEDLPVTVILGRDASVALPHILRVGMSGKATGLRFNGLMFPFVAQYKGAIGFMTMNNFEQVEAVAGQAATSVAAVKRDERTPAVGLSRITVFNGMYPLTKDEPASLPLPTERPLGPKQLAMDVR